MARAKKTAKADSEREADDTSRDNTETGETADTNNAPDPLYPKPQPNTTSLRDRGSR